MLRIKHFRNGQVSDHAQHPEVITHRCTYILLKISLLYLNNRENKQETPYWIMSYAFRHNWIMLMFFFELRLHFRPLFVFFSLFEMIVNMLNLWYIFWRKTARHWTWDFSVYDASIFSLNGYMLTNGEKYLPPKHGHALFNSTRCMFTCAWVIESLHRNFSELHFHVNVLKMAGTCRSRIIYNTRNFLKFEFQFTKKWIKRSTHLNVSNSISSWQNWFFK